MIETRLQLDKYRNTYLLYVSVYKTGHHGDGTEIHISKEVWDELKELGIEDLTEVE